MPENNRMICNWLEDPEGYWMGDCGVYWQCQDGGPKENGLRYCPRCGGELKVVIADDPAPQELRYAAGAARDWNHPMDITFTQDRFATVDDVVSRIGERLLSIARILPDGTAHDMAVSALSDVAELQKALQAGELSPV